MYSFESRIRYSETGPDGRLTTEKLIDYFQDCSSLQSEDNGVGVSCLREKGYAWVIVYWRVEIQRMPMLGERVRVGTIPYSMKGSLGLRNFLMETCEGERLATANSVWSLVDTSTMRPARIPPEVLGRYPLGERLPMQYDSRRIRIPDLPGVRKDPVTVREYHLDTNRHMNNGQYVRIAAGFLPADRRIRVFRIEYRLAARLGDSIVPVLYEIPGSGREDIQAPTGARPGTDNFARAELDSSGSSAADRICAALNAEDGRPYAILEAEF